MPYSDENISKVIPILMEPEVLVKGYREHLRLADFCVNINLLDISPKIRLIRFSQIAKHLGSLMETDSCTETNQRVSRKDLQQESIQSICCAHHIPTCLLLSHLIQGQIR